MHIGSEFEYNIYNLGEDGIPSFESEMNLFEDVTHCDPVIANDSIAFVSISSDLDEFENSCRHNRIVQQVSIYDLEKRNEQIGPIAFLDEPAGIALDENWLFVCERNDGLKVFDVSKPKEVIMLHHFPGFSAINVFTNEGMLMVTGENQLIQFDYSDMQNMRQISSLAL